MTQIVPNLVMHAIAPLNWLKRQRWSRAAAGIIFVALLGLQDVEAGGEQRPAGESRNSVPAIRLRSSEHDFGPIVHGHVVQHEFEFQNVGGAPLVISGVKPGCGCTTVGTWTRRVEPGQFGTISLAFNSTSFDGSVEKAAIVTCNDPAKPTISLKLKGRVWRALDIVPGSAVFNIPSDAVAEQTRVLRIKNRFAEPIAITKALSSSRFRVNLVTVKEGLEYELSITASPPFSSGAETIVLTTPETSVSEVRIPVHTIVQPAVVAMPNRITLPAGPLSTPLFRSIGIRNHGSTPVEITGASTGLADVEITIHEIQEGRLFRLNMHFPAGFDLNAAGTHVLVAKTSHPQFAEITIPFVSTRFIDASTSSVKTGSD